MTSDISKRNEEIDGADAKTIRPRSDLSYLARTSPPIPDAAMQEAHKLIEADKEMRSSELGDGDPSAGPVREFQNQDH